MLTIAQKLKLVGISIGIFVSYSTLSLVEEKIFRYRYGNETDLVDGGEGEKFRLAYSFDLMQSIFFTIIAKSELNNLIFRNLVKLEFFYSLGYCYKPAEKRVFTIFFRLGCVSLCLK